MTRIFTICLAVCYSVALAQNVGIGTGTPDPSAALEIKSTNTGILIPRVASTASIGVPVTGLLIYQNNVPSGFYYYTGTSWLQLMASGTTWNTIGNANTNPATHFIGTSDNNDIIFKRNNVRSGIIGASNVGFGYESLLNTTGLGNVALGSFALTDNTLGYGNTSIGATSLENNTAGAFNVAVGNAALSNNITTSGNTAIGYQSLYTTNGGGENVGVGSGSGQSNEDGSYIVAIGHHALFNSKRQSNITAVGAKAMRNFNNTSYASLPGNTALGYEALMGGANPLLNIGVSNTAIGHMSLKDNIDGSFNTAVGDSSLTLNQGSDQDGPGGNRNTALGSSASKNNQLGSDNISLGYRAAYKNTDGNKNVALGNNALQNNMTGSSLTSIGHNATTGVDGLNNATAVGANARVDLGNSLVLGSVNGINGSTSSVNVGINTTTPNSRLHVDGSMSSGIRVVSASVVAADINDHTIIVNANGLTVILPIADNCKGRIYNIRTKSATSFNVGIPAVDLIYNIGSVPTTGLIPFTNNAISVQSDGSDWYVISAY